MPQVILRGMRVLIVEDDALVADAIRSGLAASGFAVDHVGSAEAARAALRHENFDLIVIDLGLPVADGFSLVQRLRADGLTLPALILTARDALADRVNALDLGADDYLVKPFELPELAARCRALIRRSTSALSANLSCGPLEVDLARRQTHVAGTSIELTRREWAIIECLLLHVGQIVSKDKLQQAIASWDEVLTPNAIEVYISRLRAKLGEGVHIRTVRGLGYRLEETEK